jgi:arylesterase/paraoxonase
MKRVGIVLGVVVLCAAGLVLHTLWIAGAFKTIEPHFAGRCRLVTGPVGPEDLTIHPRTGVAYVSASDRRAVAAGKAVPGGIYAYDLDDPGATPVNLTSFANEAFQPHGISLWVEAGGREVLFVVNHPAPQTGKPAHTIEIFEMRGGKLFHRDSLTDPLLVMPNDIVAVGPDRFYVTNTHANPPGRRQTMESYLRFADAKVLYYDGQSFWPAVEDRLFPNGINVSPDGRTLYLASTTGRRVEVFDRDPETGSLAFREEIFVGSGLDNVEVEANGDLWIGAHPNVLRVGAHMADPSLPSPSQVVRITRGPEGYRVEEVYLDDGRELSASSVAAVRGRRLLVGQIASEGFLDCLID